MTRLSRRPHRYERAHDPPRNPTTSCHMTAWTSTRKIRTAAQSVPAIADYERFVGECFIRCPRRRASVGRYRPNGGGAAGSDSGEITGRVISTPPGARGSAVAMPRTLMTVSSVASCAARGEDDLGQPGAVPNDAAVRARWRARIVIGTGSRSACSPACTRPGRHRQALRGGWSPRPRPPSAGPGVTAPGVRGLPRTAPAA